MTKKQNINKSQISNYKSQINPKSQIQNGFEFWKLEFQYYLLFGACNL